jgi:cytochrome c peroxidase
VQLVEHDALDRREQVGSLRGARYLAPYGHDGRFTSLRDFVHNVIVNEFAGPEPSPALTARRAAGFGIAPPRNLRRTRRVTHKAQPGARP